MSCSLSSSPPPPPPTTDMDRLHDHHQSYSWHQSHDQATVLLLLPYDTVEGDVSVIIEEEYLVAGVIGQPPVAKGKLYGKVDTAASVWQLEPRASRLSPRERTTSSTSTASTQSSYAFVSEPEISSSFAASLEAGLVSGSDPDDGVLSSPALSSPISSSVDEHFGYVPRRHRRSRLSVSPPARQPQRISQASSYSSLESLHSGAGRLLTIHLEKVESVIWPSLIVGPVPESISPAPSNLYPWTTSVTEEAKYNMDPTSLALIALELYDIRKAKEDAFEYFIRAWHQAHLPSAAIRLATHYLPLQTLIPDAESSDAAPASPTSSVVTISAKSPRTPSVTQTQAAPTTNIPSALQLTSVPPPPPPASLTVAPGTDDYYLTRIGGPSGLAQLFLAAGLLHLEGAATPLLASSYAGLSALRAPFVTPASSTTLGSGGGVDAWRRDRAQAALFFTRARALSPTLDVPLLPAEPESEYNSGAETGTGDDGGAPPAVPASASAATSAETAGTAARAQRSQRRRERHAAKAGVGAQLEMPTLDVRRPAVSRDAPLPAIPSVRRRKPRARPSARSGAGAYEDEDDGDLSSSMMESVHAEPTDLGGGGEDDRTWYLYVPGLVGAGTALLVVGLLSLQSWRKNQG
ncbi:hypothetical protein BD413DRAFT_137456 [Trametes elegans]|nr:hypothetical protein BD413DRAFT_137456 [Trametes elegans]